MLNPQVRFVSPCLGVRRSPLLCCYKYPKKKRISLDHNKRYKSIIVKKLRKKVTFTFTSASAVWGTYKDLHSKLVTTVHFILSTYLEMLVPVVFLIFCRQCGCSPDGDPGWSRLKEDNITAVLIVEYRIRISMLRLQLYSNILYEYLTKNIE